MKSPARIAPTVKPTSGLPAQHAPAPRLRRTAARIRTCTADHPDAALALLNTLRQLHVGHERGPSVQRNPHELLRSRHAELVTSGPLTSHEQDLTVTHPVQRPTSDDVARWGARYTSRGSPPSTAIVNSRQRLEVSDVAKTSLIPTSGDGKHPAEQGHRWELTNFAFGLALKIKRNEGPLGPIHLNAKKRCATIP